MSSRLVAALALLLGGWVLLGSSGWAAFALAAVLVSTLMLAWRGSATWRSRATVVPALALLARALLHAAHPAPPRLLVTLLFLVLTGLAVVLALGPLGARSRLARWGTGFALTLAVCCVLVGALERFQRWKDPVDPYAFAPEPGSPASIYAPDPELGHVFVPGFRGRFVHPEYGAELVEINADGFRDSAWPAAGEGGPPVILMLGDSTIFGEGVEREETIPARLEQRLGHASVRVLNAGVPGYGPRHERVVGERLLERTRPRVCVVVFYDGNDLADARAQFERSRKAGVQEELLPSEANFEPPDLRHEGPGDVAPLWSRVYWMRYSSLYRDLERRCANALVRIGWMPLNVSSNSGFLRAMQREPDPGIAGELALTASALRELGEACRARGVAFVVARLPGALQVEPTSMRNELERLGLDPARFDRTLPGRVVLESARSDGAFTLDLLPELEVGEGALSPFYFREGHPNRAGNERIALRLARLLEDEKLLAETSAER